MGAGNGALTGDLLANDRGHSLDEPVKAFDVVRHWNGQVTVASELAVGTTFQSSCPRVAA